MRYFIYTVITIVFSSVIVGFFVVGSPSHERYRKLDERRINDLRNIQTQILSYWQKNKNLPKNLEELNKDINEFSVSKNFNKENKNEYKYILTGPEKFSLCATFLTSNLDEKVENFPRPINYQSFGDNWKHNTGKKCFERTIDKGFYKNNNL